jgi:CRISPR-associated endonuclease/helicase Cas3
MKYARPGQPLTAHLTGTAEKTAQKLPLKWQGVGYYAGLWHDLGKILQAWQDYLHGQKNRVPHSPHGAMLARSLATRPLAVPSLTFVIAGHHGGLRDKDALQGDHLKELAEGWEQARDEAIIEISDFLPENLPEFDLRGTRLEFAIRMLFGCLVDADRIDAAMSAGDASLIQSEASSIATLSTCFNPRHSDGALAQLRREFANDCMAKAGEPCSLFRLTGPTGVGKTMASLQFAIAHCQANPELEGILYVGPLKSIIEQTWEAYTDALKIPVLAHYSDFQPVESESSEYKLTTERWDAPVICTSGVQFYESLFARKPARCRKLSHLMRRCILIDEAQTIPLEYARPILDVLTALVEDWGCSIVLMSATQPSFRNVDPTFDQKCIDIIDDNRFSSYSRRSRRITYNVNLKCCQWDALAERIDSLSQSVKVSQSLTVVNTTRLAREGFQLLSNLVEGSWFHLSARMIPAHRRSVLKEIKQRLDDKIPCHLISTQVVEAGVDLDFPLVLRQMSPLDSIIQAAGRCNREDTMNWRDAIVQVFDLDEATYPSQDYKKRTNITREILKSYDLNEQLLDATKLYYETCYSSLTGDTYEIQKLRSQFQFEKVDKLFNIIDDSHQFSAVVPWKEGADLVNSLDLSKPLLEDDWRKLQPYTLNLPAALRSIAQETSSGVIIWPIGFYNNNFGASDSQEVLIF